MLHIVYMLHNLEKLFLKIYHAQDKRVIIEELGISGSILFVIVVVSIIYCITSRVFRHFEVREYDDLRDFLLEAGDNEVGHVHETDEEGGILEASLDDLFPNVLSTERDKKKKQKRQHRRNATSEEEKEGDV
ncbi:hypothetical protein FisN_17Lu208 [Fistulifera solaris]|uniref:Uncharacterized protein n=1 Tax=Fistulifera solaris TaxID=1519565 RepID=A0A1Z5KHP2_FISSO|nr:hypothetical protein FisN_17Lu208 [Fistulifera solaris]|eukprot:GAX25833.1 hypothetical protein FisN_17Lu208 [Fistulifera solaris]